MATTTPVIKDVEVGIIYLRLARIDTINDQFTGDIFIVAKWMDDKIDQINYDIHQDWNPELFIENLIESTHVDVWFETRLSTHSNRYIYEMRKIRGIFYAYMELHDFPVDCQQLTIKIVSLKSTNEIQFRPSTSSRINREAFLEKENWKLFDYVDLEIGHYMEDFSPYQLLKPQCIARAYVARRPIFFYYNVHSIIMLLMFVSIGIFSIQCSQPENRLPASFTLILGTIMFRQQRLVGLLPQTSYLTQIDKYIIMNNLFICGGCSWHMLIGFLSVYQRIHSCHRIDFFVMLTFIFAFVLIHIWVVIKMIVLPYRRQQHKYGTTVNSFSTSSVVDDQTTAAAETIRDYLKPKVILSEQEIFSPTILRNVLRSPQEEQQQQLRRKLFEHESLPFSYPMRTTTKMHRHTSIDD